MTPLERFIAACKLLGGGDRWQAAAAKQLEISRGYLHHLITGKRALSAAIVVKAIAVARDEAGHLRDRAGELDKVWAGFSMDELAGLPPDDLDPHWDTTYEDEQAARK